MDSRETLTRLYDACLRHNGGRLLLEGTAARAGVVTANGRVYPPKALRRAALEFSRGAVRAGLALGELDHPSYASPLYRSVSLANASHAVLRLEWRWQGRWWRADAGAAAGELRAMLEVLPTPSGLLLWALAARGAPLAVSQRCWAEVEWRLAPAAAEEERQQQQEQQPQQDSRQQQESRQQQQQEHRQRTQVGFVSAATLELLCFDFVPDPANAGAWLRPVARRVVGDGGRPEPHPSAVALAHLGAGSVSPARAAGGRAGLPTAAAVVAALRGGGRLAQVGALELRSHYDIAGIENFDGGGAMAAAAGGGQRADEPDEDEARAGELAALVLRGAPAEEGTARSLPAHWRRYAERALECEARERERARERELQQQQQRQGGGGGNGGDDESESNDGGGGSEGCLPRWLSPASWRRHRARGRRRRRGAAVAPASSAPDARRALLPPPSPPAPAALELEQGHGAPVPSSSPSRLAAEVDAVLWSRAAKARDVRRQVLLRRVPFPAAPASEDTDQANEIGLRFRV